MTDPSLAYLTGFGNEHASEAVEGALPIGQNNPRKPPLGLYAEQLSGTAFTVPSAENRRTWMYRMRPSVLHVHDLQQVDSGLIRTAPARETEPPSGQLRWDAIEIPDEKLNPNGGSIAIGHPYGMTGSRMTGHLLRELRRQGKRYGLVTMCVGGGQGLAALFEAV